VTRIVALLAVRGPSTKVVDTRPCLSDRVIERESIVRCLSCPVTPMRTWPLAGPLICTMSLRPCSASLKWIVGLGIMPLSTGPVPGFQLPEPLVLKLPPFGLALPELSELEPSGAGTVKVVSVAFAGLLSPAAFVSQMASVQVPGPGTVTL
jgi:hypothetical protein